MTMGYFITDKTKKILAASHSEIVGRDDVREYMAFLSRVMEGETVVSRRLKVWLELKWHRASYVSSPPCMLRPDSKSQLPSGGRTCPANSP